RGFTVNLVITRATIEGLINMLRPVDRAISRIVPHASTSIDLESREGSFVVQTLDDRRQWLDRKSNDLYETASWKWRVIPVKPGRQKLIFKFYAREFHSGEAIGLGPVEQEFSVRVRPDWLRQAWSAG